MKEALQKGRSALIGLILIGGVTAAFLAMSQQQGGGLGSLGGGTMCLLLFLLISMIFLIVYFTCAISCGDSDEPLDPKCVRICWRKYIIIEAILLVMLLLCLGGVHIF